MQSAIGSGIPEVKSYLNGVRVPKVGNTITLVTKIFGTILSVSSGLVVGPEGPLVHIGAIVGQGLTKTTKLDIALRDFQKDHPTLSGWLGCAKTDAFGEKRVRESLNIRQNQEELALLHDDNMEEDDILLPLPVMPGGLTQAYGIGELPAVPESLTRPSRLPVPLGSPEEASPNDDRRGRRFSPRLGFFSNMISSLSGFRNDVDRRDLISIGVATGFAAAFGAPVGGVLYSLEEASSFYSITLMWRTLAATALGTFAIAIYHGDFSRFSVLSLGNMTLQESVKVLHSFEEVPYYILMGACGGLLGAFFNGCYHITSHTRSQFYGKFSSRMGLSRFFQMAEVAVISMVTSLVTFILPFLLHVSWTCTPAAKGGNGGFANKFNCQEGEFNEVAAILLGSRGEFVLSASITGDFSQ